MFVHVRTLSNPNAPVDLAAVPSPEDGCLAQLKCLCDPAVHSGELHGPPGLGGLPVQTPLASPNPRPRPRAHPSPNPSPSPNPNPSPSPNPNPNLKPGADSPRPSDGAGGRRRQGPALAGLRERRGGLGVVAGRVRMEVL